MMIHFQDAIPTTQDTLGYLILGLIVAALVIGAYLASLGIRFRNFHKDIQMIEQLNDEK